jgi:predicted MPP superfamily phosphohydrolase
MARRALAALALAGAATLAWSVAEAHAFTLRRVTVPVLPRGSEPVRVLHLSDLHLTPGQRDKIAWVRALGGEPLDLVVTTGDNLAHPLAVPPLLNAYEPLMSRPGLFVFGSNDYFGPRPINPMKYFRGPSVSRSEPAELPVEDLRDGLAAGGWVDVNNARTSLTVNGIEIAVVGLDDPHIGRDEMAAESTPTGADLVLGVVHAPYARALSSLADAGAQLILAGHTHGGQVCVPGVGALVTNCDLDTARVKGLSRWPDAEGPWLHVSAGLGTSPFAPVRLACRPEATILTLVEA